MAEIKFGGAVGDRQIAKLNSPANFPAIRYVIFVQYSKCCSKNIQDRSKIKITSTGQYNYIYSTLTTSPDTSTYEVLSDVLQKWRPDFVYNNGVEEKLTACLMVKLQFRLG